MPKELPKGKRIELLGRLGRYLAASPADWQDALQRAVAANGWFTEAHIRIAAANICGAMLDEEKLGAWAGKYPQLGVVQNVGIVMAGNIPMVGFHDLLCAFVSGHRVVMKPSAKDEVLIRFLLGKLAEWAPEVNELVRFEERLNGCDAYIATGSNNTSRYFEQYFGKYPHIIRKNRTSVAILEGDESDAELRALADDVFLFFGLGCRNVTQLLVPKGYDFGGLLQIFSGYDSYINHNKYKNNYDYHLALFLLNRVPYLSNASVLLVENALPFSAVSVLHYRYYQSVPEIEAELGLSEDIQLIAGRRHVPFGTTQQPALDDYADGVDTMEFLSGLQAQSPSFAKLNGDKKIGE